MRPALSSAPAGPAYTHQMKAGPKFLLAVLMPALLLGACTSDEPDVEYREFRSSEGRFIADFPGRPSREARTQDAGDFRLSLVHFSVDNADEAVSISFVDYPESIATQDPAALLDGIAEGAAGAADGNIEGGDSELKSKEAARFKGHSAIDFEVEIDDRELIARAILVGTRMYLLQVVAEAGFESESFEVLTSSFDLINQ